MEMYTHISSVYSPFSDRVPLHNITSSGVLMKSFGATFLRPDDLPGVNHMGGTQYQIVLHIIFWPEINEYSCTILCTIHTQNCNINLHSKPPFSRLLRHTCAKAVMQV